MRWMPRQEPATGGGSLTTAPSDRPSVLHVPAVECTAGALLDLDAAGEVREVPVPPGDTAALARHLRVPVAAIAATAVLRTRDDRHLFVISSAAHPLFLPALAAVLCEPELFRDDDTDVLRRTGSVLGSASPLGLSEPLPTFVDVALAPHQDVWVPAGHPHAVFRTRYDELLRLTGGHPVELG
ncbi:aminoacyl-tRNA deacylase [Kineococcus rugosus]|uniref:aminoacyl-tRNA deacylase n=1 Tax=Kineococcus sp. SYSU DK002 TaxID=3383123 RepID=UPI003D7D82C1